MNNVPFPLVIPFNEEKNIYKGYIPLRNKECLIQVRLGQGGNISGSKDLQELLKGHEAVIETKLHIATDIMNFLRELKEILEMTNNNQLSIEQSYNCSFKRYSTIYNELSEIGFERIHFMSNTMNEVTFQTRDQSNRNHLFKVNISQDYPFIPAKMISVDLPIAMSTSNTLQQFVLEHQAVIDKYQALFDYFDDLDANMKIIEPDKPARSDLYRKIALGYHCWFQILLNSEYKVADGKPKNVRFFGSMIRVKELKNKWKLYAWNKELSLVCNLKNSFQLSTTNNQEKQEDYSNTDDIECGICYSYKLDDGQIPDVVCEHAICQRGYHSLCLYEWLRSNPSTITSFNVLFGKCPYCNEKITIKMQQQFHKQVVDQ